MIYSTKEQYQKLHSIMKDHTINGVDIINLYLWKYHASDFNCVTQHSTCNGNNQINFDQLKTSSTSTDVSVVDF